MNKANKILMAILFGILISAIGFGAITSDTNNYLIKIGKTQDQFTNEQIAEITLKEAKQEIFRIASAECSNTDSCITLLTNMKATINKTCSIICK